MLDWSLASVTTACDGVVVVLPPADASAGIAVLGTASNRPGSIVAGGATRSESVRAGLAAVPAGAEIVVVQDAARPLASPVLFQRVVAAVRAGADAAVPALPVSDTIKRVEANLVAETLDRAALVAVQTPQAFRARMLRDAHAGAPEATDDAALVERIGGKVVVVEGERANLKLTAAEDMVVARALLDQRPERP